jgi:hypothetical protein
VNASPRLRYARDTRFLPDPNKENTTEQSVCFYPHKSKQKLLHKKYSETITYHPSTQQPNLKAHHHYSLLTTHTSFPKLTMAPHNMERQAALKRKREELEEESRERLAKATEEVLADRAKRRRLREDKMRRENEATREVEATRKVEVTREDRATRKNKAKPEPENKRSNPRRTKRKRTTNNDESQTPRLAANEDSSKTPPVVVHQNASPPEPEEHHESDVKTSDTQGASEEELVEARDRILCQLVHSSALHNRPTQRANGMDGRWIQRKDAMVNGEDGIKQLDAEIARLEVKGYDALHLRQARKAKRAAVQGAGNILRYTGAEMRDLKNTQARCNSRLYGFADVPRDSPHLAFLSNEWWDMFAKCQAANTTSKGLELELHGLEQDDRARSENVDQYSKRASGEAFAPTEIAVEDSPEAVEALLRSLSSNSYRKEELSKSLQHARDAQAELEADLIGMADILLVQCGMLHAEPVSEQAAQGAQTTEENAAEDNDGSLNSETEGRRTSGSSKHARSDDRQSEDHNEDMPSAPKRQRRMDPEEREEHARQEARKEGNRCQIHQSERIITVASRDVMLARVAEARERLAFCRAEFHDIDEKRREIPGIKSLSRDEQGRTRVRYLAQKGRELTKAEDELRSALHEAQNAGVIVNEDCQTSNFCGCDDQTYDFGDDVPLTRLQASDVQQWRVQITGGEEKSPPTPPDWTLELKMDWDLLIGTGFGEEVSEGEDPEFDIPEDQKQHHITCQRELQQKMRQELQDHERQQNSPMISEGLDSDPTEHDLYFDLVEDNHHFDVTWDGVGHGPVKKIPPPTPAECDLHAMNRDPSISPGIEQPWCWGNVSRPLFRWTGPQNAAPGEEVQKSPENGAGGNEGEREANGSNKDQHYRNSGSGQALLFDPSAPLVDYAIEGYDGENMDGIE